MEKMMGTRGIFGSVKAILAVIVVAGVAVGASFGCHRTNEMAGAGPAERAGRGMDNAADKAGGELMEAATEVGEGLSTAAQETSDGINRATEGASKGLNDATEEVGMMVERAGEEIQESGRR